MTAAERPPRERIPAIGYGLALSAAAFSGLNSSLARYLLDDGVSAWRLTQARSVVAFVVVAALLAVFRPRELRIDRAAIGPLAFIGTALLLTQASFFLAISHIEIGVALTIQYLYPLMILIWLRVLHGRDLSIAIWLIAALALAGGALVVGASDSARVDVIGTAAAFASAVALGCYIVANERMSYRYPPSTIIAWSFLVSSLIWLVVQPPWTFPTEPFDNAGNVLLVIAVGVVGTLLPFVGMAASVHHIPALRAGLILILELVFGAAFAFALHDENLSALQVTGGVIVLTAVAALHRLGAPSPEEDAPRHSAAARV